MLFNEKLCQANWFAGVEVFCWDSDRDEKVARNGRAVPRAAMKQQSLLFQQKQGRRKQYTEGSGLEVNRNLNIYELVPFIALVERHPKVVILWVATSKTPVWSIFVQHRTQGRT
jgi:hypothetical protein